jgi:hypothetical protein
MRGDPAVGVILDALAASSYAEADQCIAEVLGSKATSQERDDWDLARSQAKLTPVTGGVRINAELALRVRKTVYRELRFFGEDDHVDTSEYSEIDTDAAWILAGHRGEFMFDGRTSLSLAELMLDGLASLNVETAEALGSYSGLKLSLCGLTSLSADVAAALSGIKYALALNGLKGLSVEVARALAEHKGSLHLNGLTDISVEVAEALARYDGRELSLGGLKSISVEVAAALAMHKGGRLGLNGLTDVSAEVATALSGHNGFIYIRGLTTVSVEVAAVLFRNNKVRLPVRFLHLRKVDSTPGA